MRRQTEGLRESPGKMKRTSARKCAELRKGHVLGIVSLQVFSDLSNDEILLANLQTTSPLLDVRSSEMLDNAQQERLAIHGRRPIRDGPVQSHKTSEQLAVRDHSTAEVGHILPVGHLHRKLGDYARIETKRSVKISIVSGWFARMGLAPVNEKDLPGGCSVQRTLICVLLDTFFDQGYDEVFVRMSCKAVLHIMRMDDFSIIRSAQSVNPNPLCRLRHSKTEPQQGLAP
jgi:hypothetical protein